MAQTLLLVPLSLSRALLAGAVGSKLQRPRGQGSRSRSASMVSPAPKRATWKSAFPGRRSLGIEHQQREVPGPDHSPRGRVLTLFTRRGEATSSRPGNRKRGSAAGRPAPLQRGPLHCLLSRPGGASGPHPEARAREGRVSCIFITLPRGQKRLTGQRQCQRQCARCSGDAKMHW